ncbi:MAG: hypothetical protein OXT09_04665 [Myxococcales bacterium]|nr:hypothetical protein [Myxococcales bacterium]
MRCEDARAALDTSRYGDTDRAGEPGAKPAVEQARAHVEGCTECEAFAERAAALDRMLALDEPQPPGPGFDTRFFARLEEERQSRKRRGLWRWTWALVPAGVAAAVALVGLPARAPTPTDGAAQGEHAVLAEIPPEDMALVMELELLEDLPVLERLEEVEAFELLETIEAEELEAILGEAE